MNSAYVYINIILMAAVTYIIRMLPLVLFRKPITNRFFRSFLYYAPYVTLAVMTFPAILYTTGSTLTAVIGFAGAIIMALSGIHFVITTFGTCLIVFLVQLFLTI